MWVKQSTAATLIVGPILDSTGAEYASAVIGDLSISKNGGTLTALAAAATLTYIANGYYTLVTTTGNLDTLGRAQITCNKATYQMPPLGLVVVPAMVFDSLVLGTDDLDTNTKKWNDLTTVALPLVPTTPGRTLDVSATGEAGIDWANIGSPTTPGVALTGTTISTTQKVDVETIKTQTITCVAGVTILANVGTAGASTAQTGDCYVIVNSGTYGNAAIKTLVDDIPTNTEFQARTFPESYRDKLLQAIKTAVIGTANTGCTTTSVVAKTLSPSASVTNQFVGLVMKFTDDTATTALRGQGATITASTAGGTFTVDNLTTAPSEDDIFVIQ